jgi:hypothetical protein
VTHSDLVHAAHWWCRNTLRCSVVLSESVADFGGESPDVIGWGFSGFSVLIECKTSRADFFADAKKTFRRRPEMGMGAQRWFFTPKGLVRPEEVPSQWGLAELRGSRVFKVKKPVHFHERSTRSEMVLLVSALHRARGGLGSLRIFDPAPTAALRVVEGVAVGAFELEIDPPEAA